MGYFAMPVAQFSVVQHECSLRVRYRCCIEEASSRRTFVIIRTSTVGLRAKPDGLRLRGSIANVRNPADRMSFWVMMYRRCFATVPVYAYIGGTHAGEGLTEF